MTRSIFKKIKGSQANPSLPSLPPGCCSSWCWPQWARAPHLHFVELRGRRNPMICHLSDSSHVWLAIILSSICMYGSLRVKSLCDNQSRQEIRLYFNFTLVLQLGFITDTSSISNFWLELIAVTANSVCGRPRILIKLFLKHLNNRPLFLFALFGQLSVSFPVHTPFYCWLPLFCAGSLSYQMWINLEAAKHNLGQDTSGCLGWLWLSRESKDQVLCIFTFFTSLLPALLPFDWRERKRIGGTRAQKWPSWAHFC